MTKVFLRRFRRELFLISYRTERTGRVYLERRIDGCETNVDSTEDKV